MRLGARTYDDSARLVTGTVDVAPDSSHDRALPTHWRLRRIERTTATVGVCVWQGAPIFRVHEVRQARRTVDLVASIIGDRPPARVVRTLP